MKKIILFLVAAGLLVGAGTAIYLFNKPHKTAEGEKPFATLPADSLFQEFYAATDSSVSIKYSEKVIQVKGIAAEDGEELQNGRWKVRMKADDEGLNSVVIELIQGANASNIKSGMNIEAKGICIDYLADDMGLGGEVQMNQGVLIEQKK